MPAVRGLESFAGKGGVTHASMYREPGSFANQRVLVVGAAFSGADIAAEIATTAESVVVSARRPLWYLPRYLGAKPIDLCFYSRAAADRGRGQHEPDDAAEGQRAVEPDPELPHPYYFHH